jgi:hypothetical protein
MNNFFCAGEHSQTFKVRNADKLNDLIGSHLFSYGYAISSRINDKQ